MTKFEINRESAELEAQRLIESEWADRGLPVDPTYIARAIGVKVFEMTFPDDVSGLLKYFEGGKTPAIFVNSKTSVSRQRFTVAHELGHFVLNARQNPDDGMLDGDVFYRNGNSSNGTDPVEVFANQFAAELLMPRRFVQLLVNSKKSDLVLAADFDVSVAAMNNRLDNLKIKLEKVAG
ncbi:MAG: ImmA/IrrE family metallo-endopeptidase [Acidimicrobiaceae bacterium]|nr:ImmA/IrrE family metallo-endopeptidase [Acidimicrobiaceae bacterium]